MKFFSYGIDNRAAEVESTQSTQNDFPQTTLQMNDFGLSRFTNITGTQRQAFLNESKQQVNDYFDNHENEVAVIQHFRPPMANDMADEKIPSREPQIMPVDVQIELLAMLQNKEDFPTQKIFYIPKSNAVKDLKNENFSLQELAILEHIRDDEIQRIRNLPAVAARLSEVSKSELALSTSLIFNKIDNSLSDGPVWHLDTPHDEASPVPAADLIVNESVTKCVEERKFTSHQPNL